MFPAKYTQLIFSFFLSIFMSCVVSAVSVFNTTGLIDGFFNLWMTAWLKSWIVAFPTILIVAPLNPPPCRQACQKHTKLNAFDQRILWRNSGGLRPS